MTCYYSLVVVVVAAVVGSIAFECIIINTHAIVALKLRLIREAFLVAFVV